ncbi:hypothetical protein HYH03_007541 [Edaphochlamys debaryana]|uniref:Uncharacterized protein n=1 Tax=Edaphochlamys debaryana TaxID=47281 RepID=A0A835Y3T4_9CHLO|nr:hypothetical protein HYH03_007541 [Edaphochlamys debaryana]|eukprot:KAG2494183.1 hypothetical protein HYH03_007541 [Edaphochlamys debaryana]
MGGQYAISYIGAFCETHGACPGAYFIFYADHDHVVRLAIRRELPEDVSAAINAARAAMAVINARSSGQAAGGQQQASAAPSVDTAVAATPPSSASLPMDDAAEEAMPLVSADDDPLQPASEASAAVVVVIPDPAPAKPVAEASPRSMPFSDRSNLPVDASARTKGLGSAKPNNSSGGRRPPTPASAGSDKENDAAAIGAVPKASPVNTATSLDGVTAPSACVPASQPPKQQQAPPRPPPPPPQAQAQQPRSPPAPSSPPAATRLRMRFEARLREQEGKLHPLSVRTGPESPLPAAPSYALPHLVYSWPPSLVVPYSMQLAASMQAAAALSAWQPRLDPAAGMGGYGEGSSTHGAPGDENMAGGGDEVEQQQRTQQAGAWAEGMGRRASSWGMGPCAVPHGYHEAQALQLQEQQRRMQQAHAQAQGPWRPQLPCNDLLDWEVGRRAAQGHGAGYAPGPPQAAAGGWTQHSGPGSPRAGPPGSVLSGGASSVQLALLRHLLMSTNSPQAQALAAQLHEQLRAGGGGLRSDAAEDWYAGQEGGGAAQTSARQQPAGATAASEADMPADPRAAPPEASPRQASPAPGAAAAAMPLPVPPLRGLGAAAHAASPQRGRGIAPRFTAFTSARQTPWGVAAPSNSPRSSGVGLARGACGPPPESPTAKRRCGSPTAPDGLRQQLGPASAARGSRQRQPQPPAFNTGAAAGGGGSGPATRHLLASKMLTTADLLGTSVGLAVAPADCARAAGLLLPEAEAAWGRSHGTGGPEPMDVDGEGQGADHSSGVGSFEASGRRVAVEVVVEGGVSYSCVLSLATCRPEAGTGGAYCPCELAGLKPYLVQRQAGRGDVLQVWVEEGASPAAGRLHAQLQTHQRLSEA